MNLKEPKVEKNVELVKPIKETRKQFLIERNEIWCEFCETITSADKIDDKIESFYQKYLFIDESKENSISQLLKTFFSIAVILIIPTIILFILDFLKE